MTDSLNEDDSGLVLGIAAGEPAALEKFYRRFRGPVLAYLLRRTGNRELAFDLAAETFANVIVASSSFDAHRGTAGGWVLAIAHNKLVDSVRRGVVEDKARKALVMEPISLDDDDLERVEELASLVDDRSVDEMLAGLPLDQREAVRSRVVDERSYREISEELQCSPAVVRQRVARGLKALRDEMKVTR